MFILLVVLGLFTIFVVLNKNIKDDSKVGYYITVAIITLLYIIFRILLRG